LAELLDDAANWGRPVEDPNDAAGVLNGVRFFVAFVWASVSAADEETLPSLLAAIVDHLEDASAHLCLRLRLHGERVVKPPGHAASLSPFASNAPPASTAAPLSVGELVAA